MASDNPIDQAMAALAKATFVAPAANAPVDNYLSSDEEDASATNAEIEAFERRLESGAATSSSRKKATASATEGKAAVPKKAR